MRTISFTEFRKEASSVIDLVEQGEAIAIRRHGKIVARLVPPTTESEPAWKRPGPKLVTKGPSLSAAILEDRR